MPDDDLSKNLSRWAAILLLPAAAAVVGGELARNGAEPFHVWDKTIHFSAYLILAILVATATYRRRAFFWALAGLIVMGGNLEIMQGLVGRDCDIRDEYANALGVIAGASIGWAIMTALVRPAPTD
jgi:VanZ family protein